MIRVRVELLSAITGETKELARMHICNDGVASAKNFHRGDYIGQTFKGRDTVALNLNRVNRKGNVKNHDRLGLHVWYLVAKMLISMGYGK